MTKQSNKIIKVNINIIDDEVIDEAAEILKAGKVIVLPTDTVYGISVDCRNEVALKRLFEIKKRSMDKPVALLINSKEQVYEWVDDIPKAAESFMAKYWPGPLTVIFKSKDKISEFLGNKKGKIGFRIPDCKIVNALIEKIKVPLATTSANISGESSVYGISNLSPELAEKVDMVLDGGPAVLKRESTVVDFTDGMPKVVREGVLEVGI